MPKSTNNKDNGDRSESIYKKFLLSIIDDNISSTTKQLSKKTLSESDILWGMKVACSHKSNDIINYFWENAGLILGQDNNQAQWNMAYGPYHAIDNSDENALVLFYPLIKKETEDLSEVEKYFIKALSIQQYKFVKKVIEDKSIPTSNIKRWINNTFYIEEDLPLIKSMLDKRELKQEVKNSNSPPKMRKI